MLMYVCMCMWELVVATPLQQLFGGLSLARLLLYRFMEAQRALARNVLSAYNNNNKRLL